jgi:uncharacterized protein (DUF58 family)
VSATAPRPPPVARPAAAGARDAVRSRATRRAVLLLLAGLPVAFLPTFLSERWIPAWLAFVGVSVVAMGVDVVLCPRARRVATRAEAPPVVYIGRSDVLRVEVENRDRRSLAAEVLVDLEGEVATPPARVASLPPSALATVELPLVPRRRGTVVVRRLWLRWEGPLGLVRREVSRDLDLRVSVTPDVRSVREAAIRWLASREFVSGLRTTRATGDGSEFSALREHVPGMDSRAIHWKASARHRRLLGQEFRAERNRQVVLAVDTGRLLREPIRGSSRAPADVPRLDHAVNAALLLSYVSLRAGDRVGLYAFDERPRVFVEPQGGLRAFPRIQSACAGLEYSTSETNFTLAVADLATRLRRRSLVVLLTEFVDAVSAELMVEGLARLSRRHLVLFVALRDPGLDAAAATRPDSIDVLYRAVVAGDLVRERETVLQRVRRLGVHVVDAPPDRVSARLVERYLDVHRRELV